MPPSMDKDHEPGQRKRVAVIVAHPDDEALWAGGLLLNHPEWSTVIIGLCRGQDPDRAPRFLRALEILGARGSLGDLDDGPEQMPQDSARVQEAILSLLPVRDFDILLTHALDGEYTRHRRHEEVAQAVRALWQRRNLRAESLWEFAYEDGKGTYLPRSRPDADLSVPLPEAVWDRKYRLITEVYGFSPTSWEARTTPRLETFNAFRIADQEIHRVGRDEPILTP
jgi:LmbE family N-acetylglucosaminyl deacetylase